MDLIRRCALLFTVMTTAIVLAGCGGAPSKASAAAVIGDERISLDEVQAETQWLLDNVPEIRKAERSGQLKMELLTRHIVRTKVHHQLVETAAEREGLRADASEIDGLLQQVGGAGQVPRQFGVPASRVREFIGDYVLLQELAERRLDRVEVEYVGAYVSGDAPGATAKDKALDLGRQIAAAPDRAKELAAQSGSELIDQSARLRDVASSQQTALLAASPLFSADEGTVVVTQPNPQQGSLWLVALVEDRQVASGASGPAGLPIAPQLLVQIGIQQLAPLADELGVQVSPRFGVWDQSTMSIAENEDQLAGYLLPVRGGGEQ